MAKREFTIILTEDTFEVKSFTVMLDTIPQVVVWNDEAYVSDGQVLDGARNLFYEKVPTTLIIK